MVEQDHQYYTSYRISEHRKRETKNTDTCTTDPSSVQFLLTFCAICWTMAACSANPLPSDDTLQVKELPFSEKLQNPCALADASRLQRGALSAEERLTTRRTMVKELKAKVLLLNDTAATILRTNVLHDCSSLKLPLVAIVPTAEDISNSEPIDVLRMFYTSLLNHTAHVYFISEQLQRYAGETCNSDGLPASAKSLSSNMRELMCILRLCILTLTDESDDYDSYFSDSTSQILNEPLMDQPLCSRRSVRDCQTVYSTVTLLTEMTSYLQNRVLIENENP